MGAIARLLNQREVPARTQHSQWNRSTVRKMLHNPAYQERAYYGKTELRPRQQITRRVRQRGLPSRNSALRERPRHEWIEIPVLALVSDATLALAQEQLEKNKRSSPRRTIEPSLLQGMLVYQRCGYGLYRASTRTSSRTIYYYPLTGAGWSSASEGSSLLQAELDRRLQAARTTDPLLRRHDALRRDQAWEEG